MKPDHNISTRIPQICARLHQRNLLASADGNVSCRWDHNKIAITPSGVNKAHLTANDLAIVTLEGEVCQGKPSSEITMHLAIYRSCQQAQAVVHAHPPHAIAYSIAHPDQTELPNTSMSELILATGQIPIVEYARPGTEAMGQKLQPHLPQHRVMILSRHGALCWGESLDEAYNGMERLEHAAQILLLAHQWGGLTELPDSEIEFLKQKRNQLGDRVL